MQLFKKRENYYLIAIMLLVIKASVLGFGLAESMLGIALVALEGYDRYLDAYKIKDSSKDITRELTTRISSLESKFGLAQSRK